MDCFSVHGEEGAIVQRSTAIDVFLESALQRERTGTRNKWKTYLRGTMQNHRARCMPACMVDSERASSLFDKQHRSGQEVWKEELVMHR